MSKELPADLEREIRYAMSARYQKHGPELGRVDTVLIPPCRALPAHLGVLNDMPDTDLGIDIHLYGWNARLIVTGAASELTLVNAFVSERDKNLTDTIYL